MAVLAAAGVSGGLWSWEMTDEGSLGEEGGGRGDPGSCGGECEPSELIAASR